MSKTGTILVTGASSGLGDQFCRTLAAQFPRRPVGEPADLDKAILYLCDPDQRFPTGPVLHLDDGQGL